MPTDGSDYYNQFIKEDKRHGKRPKKRHGELEASSRPGTPTDDNPTDSSSGSDHDGDE